MPKNPYIVIPCYREDPAVVRRTVEGLRGGAWKVVLVDDGSPEPLAQNCPELSGILDRHQSFLQKRPGKNFAGIRQSRDFQKTHHAGDIQR